MIRITTDLICDRCKRNWIGGERAKTTMANWLRMISKEKGWVCKVENAKVLDICPECNREQK